MNCTIVKAEEQPSLISAMTMDANELYLVVRGDGEDQAPVLRLRGCDNTMYGHNLKPGDKWRNDHRRADDPRHGGFKSIQKVKRLVIEV